MDRERTEECDCSFYGAEVKAFVFYHAEEGRRPRAELITQRAGDIEKRSVT